MLHNPIVQGVLSLAVASVAFLAVMVVRARLNERRIRKALERVQRDGYGDRRVL